METVSFVMEGHMESQVKLAGHPVHQMLIVFPLGLLATSLIFDILAVSMTDSSWHVMSYYLILAGVISGAVAALFGVIDFVAIPEGTRARRIGMLHGIGNAVVLGLFIASYFARRGHSGDPGMVALVLSAAGVLLALVTGWLGGELVDRLGVGVDDGAHLNAPSSLRSKSARENIAAPRPVHLSH